MPRVAPPNRRLVLAGLLSPAIARGAAVAAPPVVTVLGDSIAAGLGLAAADALPAQLQAALARLGVRAVVRGAAVSGDTTGGALARLDFSVQPDTAVCVVELGGNDFLQSVPPAETERDLRAIVARLKARGVGVVLAGGRLPAKASGDYGRAFAAIYPRVARAGGAVLAPDVLEGVQGAGLRQRDGLHPNAAGVRLVAARLAPAVVRAIAARR